MSFASYVLKKINYAPEEEVKSDESRARQREHSASNDIPQGVVQTSRGPMRIAKNGKIDGRSLARGKPKNWDRVPRGVNSYEHIILRDIFDKAKPGEEYAWDWRTESTYSDIKLRTAQLTYVYKIAEIYEHKVSLSSRPGYMVIKYVGSKA